MSITKTLHTFLIAALTSLVILGVPDGHAQIPLPLSGGFALSQMAAADPFSPVSSSPATPPRTHAMALMGESPLPPVPEKTKQRFFQADAGGSATCGILQGSRRLLCWGLNDLGQASPPPGKYRAVAMGENHGCAITDKRQLRCWGITEAYPTAAQAKGQFLAVAAGDDHTCAIRTNRTVDCWGNNDNGELDAPNGKFRQVVARGDHSCGVTSDKRLLCWGEKAFVDYIQSVNLPVIQVATGQLHACALGIDGRAKCWGNGSFGETQAPADKLINIVAGDWHTCGQRADRTAVCWGRDQYGQTQVGMDKYGMIMGGGMQTCGILREGRQLACHGSFASNEVFYPQDVIAASKAYQNDGVLRPHLAFLAIFQGVSGLLSSGLLNTGKMMDQNMGKWEGRMAPFQLAALVTDMFLGWFSPEKPDKTYELLKEIQVDVKNIERGVNEANREINNTQLKVVTAWCDAQLQAYTDAYNLLDGEAGGSQSGARASYINLLKKQQSSLTQAIDNKTPVSFPIQDLKAFKDKYLGELKTKRSNLVNSLLAEGLQSSPLQACFEKGYVEWKQKMLNQSDGYPFDDRSIYQYAYKVLRGSLLIQGEILNMEQDLGMHEAYEALIIPRADNAPAIDFNPIEHGFGFCLYADQQALLKPTEVGYSPRWSNAAGVCAKNRERVKQAYIDMVNQVEMLGGAYSDEQVVLSLTPKQMGLDDGGEKNWLWLRNVPGDRGNVAQFIERSDSSPYQTLAILPNNADARLYYWNDGGFGQGVWHSNGVAWENLFKSRKMLRDKYKNNQDEDVMEKMAQLEDLTQEACKRDANGACMTSEISPGSGTYKIIPGPRPLLFTGINEKAFWMSSISGYKGGMTFSFDPQYKTEGGDRFYSRSMRCIVAGGINKGWYHPDMDPAIREPLKLSGKVCSPEEFAAMLVRHGGNQDIGNINCGGYKSDGRCIGIGVQPLLPTGYQPYANDLGKLIFERKVNGFIYEYQVHYLESFGLYANGPEPALYNMPVINVNERKCMQHMTSKPGQLGIFSDRAGTKSVDGALIPSICGEDMDKTIRDLIPRPEFPSVPVNEVRMPNVN